MEDPKDVDLTDFEKEHLAICIKQSFELVQLAERSMAEARERRDGALNRVLGNALLRSGLDPKTAVRWKIDKAGTPIGFTTVPKGSEVLDKIKKGRKK